MSKLIPPHGGKGLTKCLLEGAQLAEEKKKAAGLKQVSISPRVKGDLIMIGIGGFSPLTGFMTKADWKGVCDKCLLADGTFWPVPVTLDISQEDAELVRKESGCGCRGDLVLRENKWTAWCCEQYPDCSIRIDRDTGEVICELYG